jgi:hypothetical protein
MPPLTAAGDSQPLTHAERQRRYRENQKRKLFFTRDENVTLNGGNVTQRDARDENVTLSEVAS